MDLFSDTEYQNTFTSISAVKTHREAFEVELKTGSLSIADVFARAEADPVLADMKVLPAIEAIPGNKKVSTRRAFGDLGISEAALIREVPIDAVAALPAAIEKHMI